MSQINTNVQSLIAQRVLGQNNQELNTTLERLSTGLRINRGKDDPAGLIASENLLADVTSLNAAIGNAERADQVVNIAEGGLGEVNSLLNELQGLLTQSGSEAGLSQEEREANQLQIDSILESIDRISTSTEFQGTQLLNGNFDFQTTNVLDGVTDFSVQSANFEGSSQTVNVVTTQSAQQGQLFLDFGGGAIDFTAGSTFTLEVTGATGSRELSFTSGTTNAQIADTINSLTDVTGVTASSTGSGVTLVSSNYGSNEFVSVKTGGDAGVSGGGVFRFEDFDAGTIQGSAASSFADAVNPVRDEGQDVGGTINGIVATGNGLELSANSEFLDVSITLSDDASDTINAVERAAGDAFDITGGGATFLLSGEVSIGGKVSIGIGDTSARSLGNNAEGFLSQLGSGQAFNVVDGDDLSTAQDIVDEAITQVSQTRGRLGAFQRNVINPTTRNLGVAVENTAAAASSIRDADFAEETAALTRGQILTQAAQTTLGLANQQPQSVLQLLG